MASWEFPCSEPIDLYVSVASGSVTITAAATDVITVRARRGRLGAADSDDADRLADDITVDYTEGRLEVSEIERRALRWHSKDLHLAISVPAGSRCSVRSASAEITCEGEPASLDVRTASGNVHADAVRGPAEIFTMSGNVKVDDVAGEASMHTASGQISLRHAAGAVTARTASGDIRIGTADDSLTVRSASGRVRIGSVARGSTDLSTVSGDVEVKVAQGIGVYLDLASVTGRVTSDLSPSDCDGQEDLRVQCRTVSGALRVTRATAAEMAS